MRQHVLDGDRIVAGKGGAWKVAYADFVTAMMAFFLVMWLISQDQKVKDSIAHYFMDPVGFRLSGRSTQPSDAGGLHAGDLAGPVPTSRLRSGGRGFGNSTDPSERDNETAIFGEFLFDDPEVAARWRVLAAEQVATARQLYPDESPTESGSKIDAVASRQLAIQMQESTRREAERQTTGVYRELLLRALTRIDWDQLAADFLWETELQAP
jgi:flagellar motor protein MotB